jgi:hypothetical protein
MSNCVILTGTWKHSRNAAVRDAKEYGLDSLSVFVPVTTTYAHKTTTYCKVALSSLSVNQCNLDWCYIQFRLLTVEPPKFGSLRAKPLPTLLLA